MAGVICAGHAIKEVMSAGECLNALAEGANRAGEKVTGRFLISDGGDGFLDACEGLSDGQRHEVECTAPLGDSIKAPILFDESKKTAYIEMALCCGLRLLEPARRNIMISGTAGLGDLVGAARELGAKRIIVGLGGSATCDGGIGFLWRLAELAGQCRPGMCEPRVALDLPDLPAPDLLAIQRWLGDIEIVAFIDVDNPLLGKHGAARVFAPQKGADEQQVEQLDGWMSDWCERVQRNVGMNLCSEPGTGAAGGLGFAMAVIGGKLTPGATAMCKLLGLDDAITPESIVVTAEGKFDSTSLAGKAPWAAALAAREKNADVTIFCGVADGGAVTEAGTRGVRVVEFAHDLPENARKSQSPELLAEAVATHLKGRSAAGSSL